MIWEDLESCGLLGPTMTIQWAEDDGPISIHEVWNEPGRATLRLIERFCDNDFGAFNVTFEWFHLSKLYCILRLLPPAKPPTVEGWLKIERRAPFGPCLKPRRACDVMLWARKGPAQSLMARDDVKVRRVPKALAPFLAEELRSRVDIAPIYFERGERGYEWQVVEHEDRPDFPDVVLRFKASSGLKPLARHLLGAETVDYPVPESEMPTGERKHEYDPFGGDWPKHLAYHRAFWSKNERARRYAAADVELERRLWKHFGSPEPGDDDSELAICVGACRWRGYRLDLEMIERMRAQAELDQDAAPKAPKTVLYTLRDLAGPEAALGIEDTTEATLKPIAEDADWKGPAQDFARSVRKARHAQKEREVCEKLLSVRRFHPDAVVVGTLSNRMAGRGGLNAHAIPSEQKGSFLRKAFLLCGDGLPEMDGGDFWSFEVVLMAAVYQDAGLIAALKEGKKFHALFGASFESITGQGYDDIYDDEAGAPHDEEMYGLYKKSVFAKAYGAQDPKLASVLGFTVEQVATASKRFEEMFPGIGAARRRNEDRFCSMRQPGGIGSRVEWHEPAEYVESFLGFRRWFSLENRICHALFNLAQAPPEEFKNLKVKLSRTAGRLQTPGGAAQTALYACAFGIQASSMRQAGNHEIQSPGATITKRLQRRIWDQQPSGVHDWVVQPLQVHDSIDAPCAKGVDLQPVVDETVESFRDRVPLLRIDWKQGKKNWGDKQGRPKKKVRA